MKVLLINLSSECQRRAYVEKSFSDAKFSSAWDLERISAISVDDIAADEAPGSIRTAEKACFKSHLRCIERASHVDGHVLIAEDDIQFSRQSERLIDQALGALGDRAWDILYTDVGFVSVTDMVDLFQLRRYLVANNSCRLLNLHKNMFMGASSYIINATSKSKVRNIATTSVPLDMPWDLLLRKAINSAELDAYVIFPFATSLSPFSNASQVQPSSAGTSDLLWNSFRQLVWVDADCQVVASALNGIDNNKIDQRAALFSEILANCLSENFVRK
jgi:GR25 family glycosyltransferase involved in LPS biosynthesis